MAAQSTVGQRRQDSEGGGYLNLAVEHVNAAGRVPPSTGVDPTKVVPLSSAQDAALRSMVATNSDLVSVVAPSMLTSNSENLVSCWYKAFSAGRSFCDKDLSAEQLVAFLKALQKLRMHIHVVARLSNFHLPPKDGCKCCDKPEYTDKHGTGLCSNTHYGCLKAEVLCNKDKYKCLCPC